MTALDTGPTISTVPRPLGRRLLTVVRLLAANPWTAFLTPLAILTFIFLLNVAIWAIIRASIPPEGTMSAVNGGGLFIFVYMLVVAVQSVNQTFGLALGYGSTRRDFILGSGVFYVLLAIGYAALLATLSLIEEATSGWGIGLPFFRGSVLGLDSWGESFLFAFLVLLLFFGIGAATASVYVRWKANGMYVFWAALILLVLGAGALTTWTGSWPAVGEFFVAYGVLGTAAWSLVVTAFCGIAAYLVLRRATPPQG